MGIVTDRLALAVRVMKARRTSICTTCRSPVLVGQQIARLINPSAWVHIGCLPIVAALRRDDDDGPPTTLDDG